MAKLLHLSMVSAHPPPLPTPPPAAINTASDWRSVLSSINMLPGRHPAKGPAMASTGKRELFRGTRFTAHVALCAPAHVHTAGEGSLSPQTLFKTTGLPEPSDAPEPTLGLGKVLLRGGSERRRGEAGAASRGSSALWPGLGRWPDTSWGTGGSFLRRKLRAHGCRDQKAPTGFRLTRDKHRSDDTQSARPQDAPRPLPAPPCPSPPPLRPHWPSQDPQDHPRAHALTAST